MESIFTFLFKYRPLVFAKGQFSLGAAWPAYLIALVAFAIAVPVILTYARARGKTGQTDRAVLAGLRIATLAVLLFCLFQPRLVLSTVVPQRNFLGILIDDSQSMQIADQDGQPRTGTVERLLGAQGSLLKPLSDKFILRFFRFSSNADRIAGTTELGFTGAHSYLGRALEQARSELAGLPLSGLVLVTDGSDNSSTAISEPLLALKASSVPVFTVGIGEDRFKKDVQLSRVTTPRSVLKGSSVVVDLVVSAVGYRGQKVTIYVEDQGQIVGSKEVELPRDGEASTVRVHFTANETGPRLFKFRIPLQAGELVTRNNDQQSVILVEDRRDKILYFEGEPRFELKFVRRAVAADKNLQLVTLQRTAENKFLRIDVDSADELSGGFPKSREELFSYRGLILGSVEAAFFTPDQLRMIAEFVSQRGGGFMMLGGRHSFTEGGWGGTPVADILPVYMESKAPTPNTGGPNDAGFYDSVKVELTPVGTTHPATQVAPTERQSIERWKTLPVLSIANPIRRIKPGATTLLTGKLGTSGDRQVILAFERYGRGKALAFTVQDSWVWQMHASIPLEDMTHETFWRQLARWLVSDVPGQVSVTASRDRVSPGEPVTILAEVDDAAFLKLNDAAVTARLTNPAGVTTELPMEWTVDEDGKYRASFTPRDAGLHEIHVDATARGAHLTGNASYVEAADLGSEYFDAEMHTSLLKRIADETGGRFYTPENAGTLPEDISYTRTGATVVEDKDLWDMPIVFLLVVSLVAAEWGYRKARGLA